MAERAEFVHMMTVALRSDDIRAAARLRKSLKIKRLDGSANGNRRCMGAVQ